LEYSELSLAAFLVQSVDLHLDLSAVTVAWWRQLRVGQLAGLLEERLDL
jgi:hypothetical protein